jgi:NADH:ubiquinone oxidoreductase subunit C
MFKSIKNFIDLRLEKNIVIDDFANDYGYFIKIESRHLYQTMFFLKNDPDVRLSLLDQIIALPVKVLAWKNQVPIEKNLELLYQFQSLKLPYRISVAVQVNVNNDAIPSISHLFRGASWQEQDIKEIFGLTFEEREENE